MRALSYPKSFICAAKSSRLEYSLYCPYNNSHVVLHSRYDAHVDGCRKKYTLLPKSQQRTVKCRYCSSHIIFEPEIELHHHSCNYKMFYEVEEAYLSNTESLRIKWNFARRVAQELKYTPIDQVNITLGAMGICTSDISDSNIDLMTTYLRTVLKNRKTKYYKGPDVGKDNKLDQTLDVESICYKFRANSRKNGFWISKDK